jgi:hypothetical protein
MSMFGTKRTPDKAKRGAAPRLEVLFESENSTKALALGVQWKRIATAGAREDAIRLARESGASHYIYANQQLGIGVLQRNESTVRVFPAAVVAARQLHGSALVALKLSETEFWLAETHDGSPTSTDLFLTGVDDAEVLERLRELRAQSPVEPTVYTNITDHGLANAKPYDLSELFSAMLGDGDRLQPVPSAGFSIPKPVLGVAVLAIVVLAGQQGMRWWENVKRQRMAVAAKQGQVDPELAWAEAIATWEQGVAAPSGQSLLAPRASLDKLPVEWGGWKLLNAQCSAQVPAGGARVWSCHAKYSRGVAGIVNREIAAQLPAGWIVSFEPLGGMQLAWSVREPVQAMRIIQLPKPETYNVQVASELQAMLPAFGGELSFAFQPVAIPAPKKPDNTAMPPDPRAEGLMSASLSIKAPLRSIDALIAADIRADWRFLSLAYQQGLQGGISKSALMAEVKGELYAKR